MFPYIDEKMKPERSERKRAEFTLNLKLGSLADAVKTLAFVEWVTDGLGWQASSVHFEDNNLDIVFTEDPDDDEPSDDEPSDDRKEAAD